MKTYKSLIVILSLSFCAMAQEEAQEKQVSAFKNWIGEHAFFSGKIEPLVLLTRPDDENPLNLGNRLLELERNDYEIHVRPNFKLKFPRLTVGLSPRFIYTYQDVDSGVGKKDSKKSELFLREGYISVQILQSLSIALKRKDLQWGESFLASPSNPFYLLPSKVMPELETGGKDFCQIIYTPNDVLSFNLLSCFSKGEYSDQRSSENFSRTHAITADLVLDRIFIKPVLSYVENDRGYLGLNGKLTIGDPLLLYTDCSFSLGCKGKYVVNDSTGMLGLKITDAKEKSRKVISQFLGGLSYTFSSGTCMSLEYLYYGPGYSKNENNLYNQFIDKNNQVLSGPPTPLFGVAIQNMIDVNRKGIGFLRKNYCMLTLVHNGLWDKIDLTTGIVLNVDDRSYYTIANVTVAPYEHLQINFNGIFNTNSSDKLIEYFRITNKCEYVGLLKYMVAIGVGYIF